MKKNYRGIMLLSVPGKVLNRIIWERLKIALDLKLRDQLATLHYNGAVSGKELSSLH